MVMPFKKMYNLVSPIRLPSENIKVEKLTEINALEAEPWLAQRVISPEANKVSVIAYPSMVVVSSKVHTSN